MYSTQASTVDFGTNTPALRAARRAMIWATVTDTSASLGRGWYRQPPSRFWARTMSATAFSSPSRSRFCRSGSGTMP